MSRIIRILAVIALALSPVWGYQADVAASGVSSPAHYPVWPSFLSTGCTALQGPGGSTSVSCGGGSFLLSQINSGYECNNVDISISSFQQGSFLVVGTVNSGSQSNTVHIDGPGDYFMQFPGFLTNNLVTLQMTAGSTGSAMTIAGITSSSCPVSSSTPTVNPSFTPTNTAVPVTGTPTAIPTHTPLPSGKTTFTSTPTLGPGSPSSSPTVTSTPGPSYDDCGTPDFPVLNCTFIGATQYPTVGSSPDFWSYDHSSGQSPWCQTGALVIINASSGQVGICGQSVTAHATGTLWMQYQSDNTTVFYINNVPTSGGTNFVNITGSGGTCLTTGGSYCFLNLGSVTNGTGYSFGITANHVGTSGQNFIMVKVFVSTSGSTTPTAVPTFTPTVTSTPVPGTTTNTPVPSDTPVPIPGAMSTAIATSTECPGGCAVAALTDVPGIATRITVDTSPFSPFTSLSLARSDCKPFGYVQIPYPVIHGTPALGSSIPLSVTWTAPVTHDWDNSNPYSNTAIQPCAMDVINYINGTPTHIWDLTYWLSVLAIAIVFIMWLIGFVGRLSGDETING